MRPDQEGPGRSARWPARPASRTLQSDGSGRPSGYSHTVRRRSSCRAIRCSLTRSATSSAFICRHQNRALVLSVDEKSQIQALDREQPVLPMMPGMPERRTHSYIRYGTTSLFAALDIASGFVIGKCYKRHRATEFLDFLKQIDAQVPPNLDVQSWPPHNLPPERLQDSHERPPKSSQSRDLEQSTSASIFDVEPIGPSVSGCRTQLLAPSWRMRDCDRYASACVVVVSAKALSRMKSFCACCTGRSEKEKSTLSSSLSCRTWCQEGTTKMSRLPIR